MTLDEAAKRHANEGWKTMDGKKTEDINPVKWASFVSGANWQRKQRKKRMYKEHEVYVLINRALIFWQQLPEGSKQKLVDWFDLNKKK